MNVTVTIRRADIAKILIKKGFVVRDIIDDPDFHWSTNFIFDATPDFMKAADDTMKLLHLTADDPKIHRGNKRHESANKRNNTPDSRGGYSKETRVVESDIKEDRSTVTDDEIHTDEVPAESTPTEEVKTNE